MAADRTQGVEEYQPLRLPSTTRERRELAAAGAFESGVTPIGAQTGTDGVEIEPLSQSPWRWRVHRVARRR